MFCPKCGNKIEEDGAIFCPNCGNRLDIENESQNFNGADHVHEESDRSSRQFSDARPYMDATKQKAKITVKKPLPKKTLLILGAAGIVVAVSATAFLGRKTTIDLNEVYNITLSGYEGSGVLKVAFDSDKFVQKYNDKLSLDKKSAKKWAKKEYGNQEYAEDTYEKLWNNNIAEYVGEILEYDCIVEPVENGELKNGDSVEFVYTDEEMIDTLEELYHCKFKGLEPYKVKGLEKLGEYDPFADIKTTFVGTEPYGTVQIENPDDELGKNLQYEVENNGTFCNGDTAKIKIINYEWMDIEGEYGKTLSRNSCEVQVEGLTGYVNSLDEISDEVLEKMKKEVADVVKAQNASADETGSTILNAEYIGNYFLKAKSYGSYDNDFENALYLCYRVDVENYVETKLALYNEVHTYYTYFRFTNIMDDGNGNIQIDYTSYERPSDIYTVDESRGSYDDRMIWNYKGYEDLETMYNKAVVTKADRYTSEENVTDVETSYEATQITTIPKTAKEYNGNYYDVINISLTWDEAKERCERKGGHLATITSTEENEWIVKNINPSDNNYCWLGGERDISGNWMWITGEEWQFSSFAEGQPDYCNSSEYYLCTYSPANRWNDAAIDGDNGTVYWSAISGYIIEWEGNEDKETKADQAESSDKKNIDKDKKSKSKNKTDTASAEEAPAAKTVSAEAAEPIATRINTALRSDFYKNGQITGVSEDYVIPDSLDRYLTYNDIANLNAKGLSYARNEMMARMGRGFKNQELADYFNSMPWYRQSQTPEDFDRTVTLPDIVEANSELMLTEEKRMGMYIE